MSEPPAILLLEHATFLPPARCGLGIEDVSLVLGAGDLVLIGLEPRAFRLSSLADGASGLIAPREGRVVFEGKSWQRMSAVQSSRMRGQIGRVFDDGGWISSIDLDENIILAQRHHSRRPDGQIREEADQLSRLFGLPAMPSGSLSQLTKTCS
jgi:phospholipid/cholesterol/gamma-HCH transport system ATP-binding protein